MSSDRSYIRPDNVSLFCNTNIDLLHDTPRGLVLEFPGHGGGSCLGGSMDFGPYHGDYAQKLADDRLLLCYTFPGPWSWMNRGSVRLIDLLVDTLQEIYSLTEDTPLITSGGSMGGLGSLIYTADTRHHVTACVAACPCYDVPGSLFNRESFPRSLLSAVACYDMPFEDALKTISPLHRLSDLRDVPYFITCNGQDQCFPADGMHRFLDAMKQRGLTVTLCDMPDLPHGGFTPEVRNALTQFILDRSHC